MRVLVTGRDGQVAQSLKHQGANQTSWEFQFAARPELDLANESLIRSAVKSARPDVVVNAAAYTAVDAAEDDRETAHQVNAVAPGILARECAELGIPLIQLSTDYVFDGTKQSPYVETDAVAPLGVYGATKCAGEDAVREELDQHIIMRTAWVYSPFGKNFLKTMLKLAETRDELNVVADQHGNPTSALDIADAIIAILKKWETSPKAGLGNTYHFAGQGDTTWHGFAEGIFDASKARSGSFAKANPIPSSQYPTPAERPKNSRMNCDKFKSDFGFMSPNWKDALQEVLSLTT